MLIQDKKFLWQNMLIKYVSKLAYDLTFKSFTNIVAEIKLFLDNPPENFPKDYLNYLANTCLSDSYSTFRSSIIYAINIIKSTKELDYYTFVFKMLLHFILFKLELKSLFISRLFFNKKYHCPYCKNVLTFDIIYKGNYICNKCGNPIL